MSVHLSNRRTHLAGLGLAAAGLGAAALGAAPAPASAAPVELRLHATRSRITLPNLPTLGMTYIVLLDVSDDSGAPAGQAFAGASVVNVTAGGPVVLASITLRLADGDIHYQRVMDRFGAFPRTTTGAILGGTGAYLGIRGEVQVTWPDAQRIDLVVRSTS